QEQGGLRQIVGRQGPRVQGGRRQVLRRRGRTDQIHRQPAQAEELTAARREAADPSVASRLPRPRASVVASPIVELPEAQLPPLLAAYNASVRSRRWHGLLVLVCLVIAVALSSVSAEVSLPKLVDNIGNFTSYFGRLLHLDSGATVWTSPTEWFWGLSRWL